MHASVGFAGTLCEVRHHGTGVFDVEFAVEISGLGPALLGLSVISAVEELLPDLLAVLFRGFLGATVEGRARSVRVGGLAFLGLEVSVASELRLLSLLGALSDSELREAVAGQALTFPASVVIPAFAAAVRDFVGPVASFLPSVKVGAWLARNA